MRKFTTATYNNSNNGQLSLARAATYSKWNRRTKKIKLRILQIKELLTKQELTELTSSERRKLKLYEFEKKQAELDRDQLREELAAIAEVAKSRKESAEEEYTPYEIVDKAAEDTNNNGGGEDDAEERYLLDLAGVEVPNNHDDPEITFLQL